MTMPCGKAAREPGSTVPDNGALNGSSDDDADIVRANAGELARSLAEDVASVVRTYLERTGNPTDVTVRPGGDLVAGTPTRPGGHFRLHVDKDRQAICLSHGYTGGDGATYHAPPKRAPIKVFHGALAVDDRGTLKTASELLQQWLGEFFSTIERMKDRA